MGFQRVATKLYGMDYAQFKARYAEMLRFVRKWSAEEAARMSFWLTREFQKTVFGAGDPWLTAAMLNATYLKEAAKIAQVRCAAVQNNG